MSRIERNKLVFTLIVLAYCIYAGVFIYRTSFTINGERYFSLFDDAMISMRYAKNLASGYGLVWNPGGERVEGYTNPLWVLYMTIFHLIPIPQSKICVFIQISAALFLMVNLFFIKKIADQLSGNSSVVSLSAVLLTAFYLPLNNWSLQGMEVSILTLIVSVSIWKAHKCITSHRFPHWLYVLLGASTLIRIDMAIPLLATLVFLFIADPPNRIKHLVLGLSALIGFLGAQTLFRLWYYGDVLPNTYYLKATGYPLIPRMLRGAYVILTFIYYLNPVSFLLPFALLLFRRDKPVLFLLWVFLGQIAYSIYVGGDAWEVWGGSNRYISIAISLFFVLFCCSLKRITSHIVDRIVVHKRHLTPKIVKYSIIVLVLISILDFNTIYGIDALREWSLVKRPYHVLDNRKWIERALLLNEITTPEAKIAVVWAGSIPYFSNRYAIDLLGKNDRVIAHQDMRIPSDEPIFTAFFPGHLKWDYDYSIGQLKPDAVVQRWRAREELTPYLDSDYVEIDLPIEGPPLYLRRASEHVLWDKIDAAAAKYSD
jgi:hypothetical protein